MESARPGGTGASAGSGRRDDTRDHTPNRAAESFVPVDPAEWIGEVEDWPADTPTDFGDEAEHDAWLSGTPIAELIEDALWWSIRTRPSPEAAAELQRRYPPEKLLEISKSPGLWNLIVAAASHGAVVLDSHRNDPPPQPEKPRAYIAAAMRREAEAVLRAPRDERPAAISRARTNLERFVMAGLDGWQLERFLAALEAADER